MLCHNKGGASFCSPMYDVAFSICDIIQNVHVGIAPAEFCHGSRHGKFLRRVDEVGGPGAMMRGGDYASHRYACKQKERQQKPAIHWLFRRWISVLFSGLIHNVQSAASECNGRNGRLVFTPRKRCERDIFNKSRANLPALPSISIRTRGRAKGATPISVLACRQP